MVAYKDRLERLGYKPDCAAHIVSDYIEAGKLDFLVQYIEYKEAEKNSISEHVMEVLG